MSTHRTFKIEATEGFQITLEINLGLMTPHTAAEVNSFWHQSDRVLGYANGDPVRAVALRAARFLLCKLFNGSSPIQALVSLSKSEGWPMKHGIKIVDSDVPSFRDLHFYQILEESER